MTNLFRYMVQPGDTMEDLAAWCNTSVDELEDLNPRIDPDNIRAGQVIVIPEPQLKANELWPVGPWGPWGWGGGFGWGWRPWGIWI